MAFVAEKEGFVGKVLLYMDYHNIDDFPDAGEEVHKDFAERYDTNNYEYELPLSEQANDYVRRFATLHDYVIPFRTEDPPVTDQEKLEMFDWIERAIELDPHCYDALRIKCFIDNEIHSTLPLEDDYEYLLAHKQECYDYCLEQRNEILKERCGCTDEDLAAVNDIGLLPECVEHFTTFIHIMLHRSVYPYLRWLSSLADTAYHLGRYSECLQHVTEALLIQRSDPGDVRRVGYLAAAKLQDDQALEVMTQACPYKEDTEPVWEYKKDAWYLIACLYLHYTNLRLDKAQETLEKIFELYPGAEEFIYDEITIGRTIYAYPDVVPHSSDELLLALSYGKPLLLEGAVTPFSECLISWIHKLRDEKEIPKDER